MTPMRQVALDVVQVMEWRDCPAVIKAVSRKRFPAHLKSREPDLVFVREWGYGQSAWDALYIHLGATFSHEMQFNGFTIRVSISFCPKGEAQ